MPTALITGAASGIGRAAARALASDGYFLVLADVDETGLAETARAPDIDNARLVRCDVSREADVEAAVRATLDAFGSLDVLVQSAGIEGAVAPLVQLTADDWARVFGVNVMGSFFGLRHALPVMARGGAVVNVASVAGLNAFPLHAAYAASKHAVVGLTRTAALEAARQGVRVNAVCPGFTDTPMVEDGLQKMGMTLDDLTRRIPARRLGTADEVAAAIAYLCSDAAAYVTGQTLVVDGGIDAG